METYLRLPLDALHESPFNPRKHFDEAALQSLAADIRANGIDSPLLVRPRIPELFRGLEDAADTAACGYELVFGHRRLRAAELAGLTAVPCIVRSMTDTESRRAQVAENLSRADVHPIEEAEGFQGLIDDGSETAASLAERYGKSLSYVYARLALLKAVPQVRTACLQGEVGSEVALLISRLRTARLQERALARIKAKSYSLSDGGARSYREIRDLLREEFTLDLSAKGGCIFDLADDTLVPLAGACITCPKRSGNAPEYTDLVANQPGRWSGHTIKGSADLCTDPDCFSAKKTAHLQAEARALARNGKIVIDGNRARNAIGADGTVKGGYLPLAGVGQAYRAAVRAAQLDSKIEPPQVFTLQDPRTGKTVEAVRESELVAAGALTAKPAAQRREQQQQANLALQKKSEEELRQRSLERTAANMELLHRVRAAAAARPRDEEDLRLVALTAMEGVSYPDRKTLCELWGCATVDDIKQRTASMTAGELTALLMDCVLVQNVAQSPWHEDDAPDALLATAARYGVPPPVGPDTQPEALSTPSPAAHAADTTAVRTAQGARYVNPLTGETWSGRGLKPRWLAAALGNGRTLAEFDTQAPGLSTPSPAAQAPGGEAEGAHAAAAACEEESQTDDAGCAGKDQFNDAGVTASGCPAEPASATTAEACHE